MDFIKSMTVGTSGNELIIVNEAGRQYTVKISPPMRPIANFVIWASILSAMVILVFIYREIWKKRDPDINRR
jgi:hypothetical protein